MSERRISIARVVAKYRQRKNLSYEELADMLNVSETCLRDLEEGRLTTYSLEELRRVLKRFAYVCDLDFTRVLELCEKEYQEHRENEASQVRSAVWLTPRLLRYLALGGVALVIVGYVSIQAYTFARRPALQLSSPDRFETVQNASYTLDGSLNPDHTLNVNGSRVKVSSKGTFELQFRLQAGYNTLRLLVEKPSGQTQTKTKIIYYEQA